MLTVVVTLLILASPALAQTDLSHLDKLAVTVEEWSPLFTSAGYNREAVRNQVERRLLLAGVPVVAHRVGISILYLNLSVTERHKGLYALSVRVELMEPVFAFRNKDKAIIGVTWSEDILTLTDDLGDARSSINILCDEFIAEYKRSNSRRGEAREN
jgi:hypothetical protein